ncbi:MAG: hypothetical protein KF847_20960 [Pirellulales bacterium]|nr:hypothetical protein [Pirellulales bacterium]
MWLLVVTCGVAVPLFGSPSVATGYLSVVATVLVAVALVAWTRLERLLLADELPGVTLAVAGDPTAFGLFQSFGKSMREMVATVDPIYRQLAMERFGQLVDEAACLAAGRIDYLGTEGWRSAYEQLLRSRGLYRYRSVAYVRTPNYWQDEPGRQSMRLNFEMVESGLYVERVVIIPDAFWPMGECDPIEPIGRWVSEQLHRGVRVWLVRDSLLEGDQDLLADFGLYGNRAVGFQQIDEHGRTVRFTLSFDFAELMAAERRWERLMVYAAEFGK